MRSERKYYVDNIIKAKRYLIASIALAAAGAIYEAFSHGVYSNYMIFAFMVPLVMGCLPYIADDRGIIKRAGQHAELLLLASIVTLSTGSVVQGILEIYGTTNGLTAAYPVISALLLAATATAFIKANVPANNCK